MALVAVTLKIMPSSPSVDLKKLKGEIEAKVKSIDGIMHRANEEPIAFGLKALIVIVGWKEDKNPDILESSLAKIKGVGSVNVTDVRRAIG